MIANETCVIRIECNLLCFQACVFAFEMTMINCLTMTHDDTSMPTKYSQYFRAEWVNQKHSMKCAKHRIHHFDGLLLWGTNSATVRISSYYDIFWLLWKHWQSPIKFNMSLFGSLFFWTSLQFLLKRFKLLFVNGRRQQFCVIFVVVTEKLWILGIVSHFTRKNSMEKAHLFVVFFPNRCAITLDWQQ